MIDFPYLKMPGNAGYRDRYVTKAHNILHLWNGQKDMVGSAIIGVPLSKPSISLSGASESPGVIRQMFSTFSTYAIEEVIDLQTEKLTDFGDVEMHLTDVPKSHNRIYQTLTGILTNHARLFPIVLGGDHSISFPSIKAFSENKGKIGIIQFDAHLDLRNRQDGGTCNGTPFRALIEEQVINGDQLVQIGMRNFFNSRPYHDYAEEQGVTVYTMKAVRNVGIDSVLKKAICQLKKQKVDAIYVSLDMDVLDQAFAPGCPAIGPGGMSSTDLLSCIPVLAKEPIVKGMDIVEIDPTVDFRNMTSKLAAFLILTFILHRV